MTAIRHNLGSSFNQMRAIYGAPKGTKKKKKDGRKTKIVMLLHCLPLEMLKIS